MDALGAFIGREHLLTEIEADLADARRAPVHEILGIHGAGKTTLLNRLGEKARERPNGWTLKVDMDRYVLGDTFTGDLGQGASLSTLRETFGRACQLLTELTEAVTGRPFSDSPFREYIAARHAVTASLNAADLVRPQVEITNNMKTGWRSRVTDSSQQINVNLPDEGVHLRGARVAVSDAFVEDWKDWSAGRTILLAVDGFEEVADQEIGQWFLEVATRLANTVVVVARVPSPQKAEKLGLPRGRIRSHRLANFTVTEVRSYLDVFLAPQPVDDEMARVVHAFTGGHPGGLELASSLIGERGAGEASAHELEAVFRRIPDRLEQRWAELVKLITDTLEFPGLREAIDVGGVVHFFDQSLLDDLIAAYVPGPAPDTSRLIEVMESHGLADRVELPELGTWFRLPEYLRRALDHPVAKRALQFHEDALHARAADHYFDLVSTIEEDRAGLSYGAWYRYEKPEWQMLKREWLYHTAHRSTGRDQARLQFAQLFLDAFWWWGYYLEFGFCREVLDDWDRVAAGNDDRAVLELLRSVLDHYPTGYAKPPGAHWVSVRQSLLELERRCELRRPPPMGSHLERHVAGLINIFLAHTCRYQDPPVGKAAYHYTRATTLFEGNGDAWNQAWIALELADLFVDQHEPDLGQDNLRNAASIALDLRHDDDRDEELAANIHRVQADIHWLRNDVRQACVALGRAIWHAYLFQNTPHPPDAYTRRFYGEMLERTTGRLVGLWRRGRREEAVAMARVVSAAAMTDADPPPAAASSLLEDLLDRGDESDLARTLFPAEPEASGQNTTFLQCWLEDTIDIEAVEAHARLNLAAIAGRSPEADTEAESSDSLF